MSKIFAHRGFSGKYPENTMLAFEKAVEIGVDGIEMDVHLTKDNELVIIHDENIRRTCNGEGLVRDMTLEELRKYDASATYVGVYGVNPIPTLREYFELVKDTDIITNIELKTGIFEYPTIEKRVIDMIYEYGLQDKIILSSFNHFTVKRCEEIAPEITKAVNYEILNGLCPCFRSIFNTTLLRIQSLKLYIRGWHAHPPGCMSKIHLKRINRDTKHVYVPVDDN